MPSRERVTWALDQALLNHIVLIAGALCCFHWLVSAVRVMAAGLSVHKEELILIGCSIYRTGVQVDWGPRV